MRSCIALLLLCLFSSATGAEDCIASVYSIGEPSQRGTQNCERHPARRQRDDRGAQIPAVWFQGEGDEQNEWQFRDSDDYRPRTLY